MKTISENLTAFVAGVETALGGSNTSETVLDLPAQDDARSGPSGFPPKLFNPERDFFLSHRTKQLKRANCNAADCLEVVEAGTIKRPAWVRKTRARLGVSNLSQTVWSSMERGIVATMRQVKRSDNRAVNLSEAHGSLGELCLRSLAPPVRKRFRTVQYKYMRNLIEIHFDGGCKPTNPGNKYGSFEIQLDMKQVCKISRMELGWGTNNEAEFDSLIAALEWTVRELWRGGFPVSQYTVHMFTDSTVVANRIKNRNCTGASSAAKRMAKLTRQALSQLTLFRLWNIEWRSRDNNVERFGH